MKREYKKLVDNFEKNARPVEMVNYIMQQEIINLLKEIRKELKELKN